MLIPETVAGSVGQASSRGDWLRWLVFTLILISLSRVHIHLGIGSLRPAMLLVGLSAAFAVMHPHLVNSEGLLRYWPARVFVALGVVGCLSAAFGISLGGAATFFLDVYVKVLAIALLTIAAIRRAEDLATFIWAYVISCGLLAYYAFFVFEAWETTSGIARLNNLYTFDANDIGVILNSGLPLTLLVFQTGRRLKRITAGVILLGIGATIARTGSRGGFLGFVVVGLALLLWAPGVSAAKRLLFVTVASVGLIVAAPQGFWTRMSGLTEPTEDYNWNDYYGRRQLAERGIGYMLQYPVFGVGVGQFPRADGTMSDRAVDFVDQIGVANRWRAVHNSYVQAGSEMGITGLALWVSLLFGSIVSAARVRRRLPRGWIAGTPEQRFVYNLSIYLPIALIGFAVCAFFVSFAYIEPLYLMSAFLVGLHICVADLRKQTRLGVLAGRPVKGLPGRTRGAATRTLRVVPR